MIHFPQNAPLNYSHSSVQQRSEVSVQTTSEGQSTRVSYSQSYRYEQTSYTPSVSQPELGAYAPRPADTLTYTPANTGEEKSSAASQASAIEAAPEVSRNDAANTILAFIEQRLATDVADGAEQEALQSRLAAGLEGFIKGFQEAYNQLAEMGLLEGDVKSVVEQTFNQVINGIGELAEKYGLENPAADIEAYETTVTEQAVVADAPVQAPVQAQQPQELLQPWVEELQQNKEAEKLETLIAPTQSFYDKMDEEQSESRLYSFQLRTNDGDVVNIRSYADQGERLQLSGGQSQYDADALQDFQMRVEGDLDVEELRAINDLLSQLNDVSGEFFNGNVYDAYQMALDVGFDSDEIARFSLNLSQTQYQRVEQSYGSIAQVENEQLGIQQQAPVNVVSQLGDFMKHLQELNQQAANFDRRQLPELADFVSKPRFAEHPQHPHFKPFMAKMLGAM